MNDQAIEQEIQAKGLTAPRVTNERIDELMARVVYSFDVRPNGSTSTLVHAFLDGKFYLASGHSACVSPENFDAEMGMKIAKRDVEGKARQELWKLEGYALRDRMERADRGDENQYADEQNQMRLEMAVALVKILGLPYSATCADVVAAVHDLLPKAPASDRPPHQQRVIDEKRELDEKRLKLASFFSTPTYLNLDIMERSRLTKQGHAMSVYSDILGERIAAFDA